MKKTTPFLSMALFSLTSFYVFAVTPDLLMGRYLLEFDDIPLLYIATFKEDGNLELIESGVHVGFMMCRGNAQVVGVNLESRVVCENGEEFTQRVYDVDKIENTDSFSAEISSSLFDNLGDDMRLKVSFSKIDDRQLRELGLPLHCLEHKFGQLRDDCLEQAYGNL